jgi:hypothetical protein
MGYHYTWPCLGLGRAEESPTLEIQAQAQPGPTNYPPSLLGRQAAGRAVV